MATLINSNESYFGIESIRNTVFYATVKFGVPLNHIGGIGVDCYCPTNMVMQFIAVKRAFYKLEPFHRQVRHFVLSFSNDENISPNDASLIAYEIAKYYGDSYQIVFGVHENTDNLHVHFILNTVNYRNGSLFSESSWMQRLFKDHINKVLERMTNGRAHLYSNQIGYDSGFDDFDSFINSSNSTQAISLSPTATMLNCQQMM